MTASDGAKHATESEDDNMILGAKLLMAGVAIFCICTWLLIAMFTPAGERHITLTGIMDWWLLGAQRDLWEFALFLIGWF